ncbi:hypothetical protein [Fusobacterium varium]|uniref:hypothetical protein n=1 Tax=Fusobacterium varium TaxID=856 RepID=UPI0035657F05
MIKFIEKDIKKACKVNFSFFINKNFLNNVKSLTIWVTGYSISLKDLELFSNLTDLYINKSDEKLNRWDYINDEIENNLFSKKMDISSDKMLKETCSKGKYLGKKLCCVKRNAVRKGKV